MDSGYSFSFFDSERGARLSSSSSLGRQTGSVSPTSVLGFLQESNYAVTHVHPQTTKKMSTLHSHAFDMNHLNLVDDSHISTNFIHDHHHPVHKQTHSVSANLDEQYTQINNNGAPSSNPHFIQLNHSHQLETIHTLPAQSRHIATAELYVNVTPNTQHITSLSSSSSSSSSSPSTPSDITEGLEYTPQSSPDIAVRHLSHPITHQQQHQSMQKKMFKRKLEKLQVCLESSSQEKRYKMASMNLPMVVQDVSVPVHTNSPHSTTTTPHSPQSPVEQVSTVSSNTHTPSISHTSPVSTLVAQSPSVESPFSVGFAEMKHPATKVSKKEQRKQKMADLKKQIQALRAELDEAKRELQVEQQQQQQQQQQHMKQQSVQHDNQLFTQALASICQAGKKVTTEELVNSHSASSSSSSSTSALNAQIDQLMQAHALRVLHTSEHLSSIDSSISSSSSLPLEFLSWLFSQSSNKFYNDPKGLWNSLWNTELRLSPEQIQAMEQLRDNIHGSHGTSNISSLRQVEESFEQFKSLYLKQLQQQSLTWSSLRSIFTPEQLVKYCAWVEQFGHVCVKINCN